MQGFFAPPGPGQHLGDLGLELDKPRVLVLGKASLAGWRRAALRIGGLPRLLLGAPVRLVTGEDVKSAVGCRWACSQIAGVTRGPWEIRAADTVSY